MMCLAESTRESIDGDELSDEPNETAGLRMRVRMK